MTRLPPRLLEEWSIRMVEAEVLGVDTRAKVRMSGSLSRNAFSLGQ